MADSGDDTQRRSPFRVGLIGAAGVAVTYALAQIVLAAQSVLILIGVAGFVAVGLDPAVRWLARVKLPRWAAVTTVSLAAVGVFAGFLTAAIPPLVAEAGQFVNQLPQFAHQLQDHSSLLGRLNDRFQLQQRLEALLSQHGSELAQGLLGAGRFVFDAVVSTLTVIVLSLYFLADLPRIRTALYRLVPRARRARATQLGDEMLSKVGAFVLGNLLTSLIAGLAIFVWCVPWGIPYAVLLALLVAILDLIPIIGWTSAGIVVSLVALSVSPAAAFATIAYILVYRFVEDYVLIPKVIGRVVKVPAVVTIVATVIGGVLLGLVGILVAIPVAAALQLLMEQVVYPRLDR
ncbi:AI-2E family transporter [Amycolatopsis rhizosphaerae]|uniref:AI-2E family transporter n=1 Tax=Amycolatopsis rhizosphaerae TaxID=2053003 RepID=A0A558CPJ8_9PSEU|nr:AI-2E family transporter [Amycolatopsis rhizosphaerae]TVT50700.1 AI-2E family transporter [Amycolatopsis rhizosphaerae]